MDFIVRVKPLSPRTDPIILEKKVREKLAELEVQIQKKEHAARLKVRRAEEFPIEPHVLHLIFHVAHVAGDATIGFAVKETLTWLRSKFNVSAKQASTENPKKDTKRPEQNRGQMAARKQKKRG